MVLTVIYCFLYAKLHALVQTGRIRPLRQLDILKASDNCIAMCVLSGDLECFRGHCLNIHSI